MAIFLKYQGQTIDYTTDVLTKKFTYISVSEQEIDLKLATYVNLLNTNTTDPDGSEGRLIAIHKSQDEGPFYQLQLEFSTDLSGTDVVKPQSDEGYGQKSATLKSIMLSQALEQMPNYKMCWNNFLLAKSVDGVTEDLPAWWEEDTDGTNADEVSESFKWVKSRSEIPQPTVDPVTSKSIKWVVIKVPTKPGVQSREVAHYSITESARFQSDRAAGTFVQNKLNKIGSPDTTFNINATNWKCDDASVQWTGEYWLATLTWTSSIGEDGWDDDLYGVATL